MWNRWPGWAALVLFAAASHAEDRPALTLTPVDSVNVYNRETGYEEPSGLALKSDTGTFWTVSDDTRRLLELRPDGATRVASEKHGSLRDLEGVAEYPQRGMVLMVSEARSRIIGVSDWDGQALLRIDLATLPGPRDLSKLLSEKNARNGLEGLAVYGPDGPIFLVKERDPRLLIELSGDMTEVVSVRDLRREDGFHAPGVSDDELDVSGLAADTRRGGLWFVSDAAECVFFFDLASGHATRFALEFDHDGARRPVRNPEGIALGPEGNSLFIVTDDGKSSRLHRYRIHASGD